MSKQAQTGTVTFISVRPERLLTPILVEKVDAIASIGLRGDRYKNQDGPRQVTLIQAEHLDAVASMMGKETISPLLTRRNVVVKGINLLSLKGCQFKVGEAVFEYTGECQPCSRMEENLGEGGYNAMRGHGGITARVITGGSIRVGDPVTMIND